MQRGTPPSPSFIGLAPVGLSNVPALEEIAHALPYQELHTNKAYAYPKRARKLRFKMMTPVKKQKGQEHFDAWL